MVTLIVSEPSQISMLEWELAIADIDHTTEVGEGKYGFEPPHLIVDGVPLDFERSLKWIEERCK